MSRLLKSGDGRITQLSPTNVPRLRSADEVERDKLNEEIKGLHRELGLRDVELIRVEEEAQRAFDDGESKGRQAGLAEAERDSAARIALLQEGIEAATKQSAAALSSLETLSGELAWLAIHKILGSPSVRAELVSEIIHQQVRTLGARTIVRIEVSPQDFQSDELSNLVPVQRGPEIELRISEDLVGGDCRIKLVLGGLDVGLGQQMERLRSALADMVGDEVPV